jgi:hypothetical protein
MYKLPENVRDELVKYFMTNVNMAKAEPIVNILRNLKKVEEPIKENKK